MTSEKITADRLETEEEYQLLRKLEFHEILPFVFENIRQATWPAWFFFGFHSLVLLYLVVSAFLVLPAHAPGFWSAISLFFSALILFPLVLAPLHELIHGLVYKWIGAPAIRYGADLSQFIFYVTAHRYAVGQKEFFRVAFTPFLLISLGLLAGIILLPPFWSWGLTVTLLSHGSMCIGDFSMMSYFKRYPDREIYTFDDTETMVSYFYGKIINGKTEQDEAGSGL